MQRLRTALLAGASMLAASGIAGAQLRSTRSIPAAYIPPAGQCRVWVAGLAAAQQPAPTDCATARANLRPNTRLVYGAALRPNGTRTGGYDPRRDPNSGRYDPRDDDRDRGVWSGRDDDRRSDKDRRKEDKERRKWDNKRDKEREKEWKRSHRRGHDDGDDDEDEDDDDDGDHRGNRDRGVWDGQVGRDGRDNRDGRTDQEPWWRRGQGAGRTDCVDRNRDGVCDSQQGMGRVRVP